MSTIIAQNFSDSTLTVVATTITQGAPKAWVKAENGGIVADSYNIASVTDEAAGAYRPNFSTLFLDTSYVTTSQSSFVNGVINGMTCTNVDQLSSSMSIRMVGIDGTQRDPTLGMYAAFHGALS